MALIYGSTTIPATGTINYGSTALTKVVYGSTTVWTKDTTTYFLGNSGNNTAKASTTTWASSWYGNPVKVFWSGSINASNFSTIYFDIKAKYIWYTNPDDASLYVNSVCRFGLTKTTTGVGSDINTSSFSVIGTHTSNNARATTSLNISSLTGTYYIKVGTGAGGGGITQEAYIYNIWAK